MKLKNIALDKLSISKLNMRAKDKNPDISDILPSIRENGVHQTLLVRPEGDGFGIVAGRRRYYALLKVAEETNAKLKAPCGILDSDDDAAAIEASLIENLARLPATELEQFAAFKALKITGRNVADIANHFGVTELKVKRILALANLKSLQADAPVVEALTYAIPVDMAAMWEPDEAFFDILRDKKVINAMVKDIAGKAVADGCVSETGKTQKQIILSRSVTVDINSVIRSSADTFEIRWSETSFRKGSFVKSETYTASLNVITTPPTDAETLHRNPLGLYVHGLNWSKDLNSTGDSQ